MSNILWGVAVFCMSMLGLQPWRLIERSFLSTFQWRDLDRAFQTMHGHPVWFGPELTGGGHLPGGFYSWLLSLPLMLWPTWVAAWWWMVVLAAFSVTAGFLFLKNRFSLALGFCWAGLFLCASNVHFYLTLFINPSFLFFFITLATIAIVMAATARDDSARERAFIVACAMIALSMQMHYSSASLLGALVTVAINERKQFRVRAFAFGAIAFLSLIVPFLLWSVFHRGPEEGGNFGDALPTLLGVLATMFRTPDLHFAKSFFEMTYYMLPLALPLMLLTLVIRDDQPKAPRELKPLLICVAWTFLPFCLCFFLPGARRYGVPFLISILLMVPIVAVAVLQSEKRMRLYILMCMITSAGLFDWIFVSHAATGSWESRKVILILVFAALAWFFDLRFRTVGAWWWLAGVLSFLLILMQMPAVRPESRMQAMLTVGQWRDIWQYVYARAPMSFEELRQRIYMVRGHCLEDARLSYEEMVPKIPPGPTPAYPPDGFIVAPGIKRRQVTDLSAWLLSEPIAADIKKSIRDGELKFDEPYFHERVMIVGYHNAHPQILPPHFHNMAWGYHKPTWPESTDEKSSVQTSPSDFVFSWNECEGHDAECASGISIHFEKDQQRARIRIFGQTLSQLTNWITPNWTQVWKQPYFQVKCGGRMHKFVLLDSVGLDERYMTSPDNRAIITRNSSLIAPVEKEITIPCAHPEEMGAGRSGGIAAHLTQRIILPPVEMNVGWPFR